MNKETELLNDNELVDAIRSGNRMAFEQLVKRYQEPLLRVAKGQLGHRERAEEAVQEAFVSVYRSLGSFDKNYSFRTWLWTILLNQCRQSYKRTQRVPRVISWSSQDEDASPVTSTTDMDDPVLAAIESERRDHLEAVLRVLPDAQATSIRLRFYAGLKFQEIADAMDCSLSSAKNRVRVALEKMSDLLADRSSLIGDKNENTR